MTRGIPKTSQNGAPTVDGATWFNATAFASRDDIDRHNAKAARYSDAPRSRREKAHDRRYSRKLGKVYERLMRNADA